jgi:putative endonuclease
VAKGWEIVERNARTRYGELDIVALDGPILVFVEVKGARAGTRFGPEKPILSIDFTKQRRVRRLGTAWMAERRDFPPFDDVRFDAVGVTLDHAGRAVEIEYVPGAF